MCNMKIILILCCVAAATWCAPFDIRVRDLPALRHEEVHDEFGQYAFRYITAENTVVSERGRLVPSNSGDYVMEIEGQYQYVGDDGQVYVTRYRGGRDGFHVIQEHLPLPVVPVPSVAK